MTKCFLTVTILFLKLWEFLSWKATARRPGIGISKSSVLAACKFSAVLAMQLLLISNWIVGNPYGIILPTRYDDKVDYLLDLNLFAPSGAGHRPNVAILVCLVQQLPPVSSSFHYPVFLCPDFISMCSGVATGGTGEDASPPLVPRTDCGIRPDPMRS